MATEEFVYFLRPSVAAEALVDEVSVDQVFVSELAGEVVEPPSLRREGVFQAKKSKRQSEFNHRWNVGE